MSFSGKVGETPSSPHVLKIPKIGLRGLSPHQIWKTVRLDADHRRVAARTNHRAIANHVVVLAINPVLRRNRRPCEQLLQIGNRQLAIGNPVQPERADFLQIFRLLRVALVNRRFIGNFFRRNVRHDFAVVLHDHPTGVRDKSDFRPRQIPFVENPFYLGFAALVDDDEHPLLRFGEHEVVAGHVRRALRHLVQLDFNSRSGARRRFTGRTGQSRRAHVLNARDRAGGEQLQATPRTRAFP